MTAPRSALRSLLFTLLAIWGCPSLTAHAEDAPKKAPANRLPLKQAADEVLAAHEKGDTKALAVHAGKRDPDPWLVAAELCHRKQHDAAAALATATTSPFLAGLDAYVAGRRTPRRRASR
ncbi:MAG: hypothetical protein ACYTGN_03640 [Planctomycetota bacterium]